MASESSVTLMAQCLCKAHTFTTQAPQSRLPLPASACHCDSCRHLTGALYSIDAPWPEQPANMDVSKLKAFKLTSRFELLFCSTCSTPMFFSNIQNRSAELGVFTGTLKNNQEDIVKIVEHIFVGDTKDGGASMWLRKPNADGTEAKRFEERSEGGKEVEISHDWSPVTALSGYNKKLEGSLPLRCKCKGIDLVLHLENYDGKTREELPWYVDPVTHKLYAGFCACDSCRLSSGVDVYNWTFADLTSITYSEALAARGKNFPKDNKELQALVDTNDPAIGALTYYESSPGVQRYFCGKCSSQVFYTCDDRGSIVDVAIGILEAPDGARAEGFLSWGFGTINRMEDTRGGWREGLMSRVKNECEEWRTQRGYPKNWRRVERDQAEAKGQA